MSSKLIHVNSNSMRRCKTTKRLLYYFKLKQLRCTAVKYDGAREADTFGLSAIVLLPIDFVLFEK